MSTKQDNKENYNDMVHIVEHNYKLDTLEHHEELEEETFSALSWQIVKISIPLVLTFISLSLLATFMFYLLRNEKLEMTEGFSLGLLYFNCFIIGIFWGSSFGFQILGSNAFGKNKPNKLNEYLHQSIACTLVLSIIIAILSIFVVPKLIGLLNPNPEALAIFTQLMKTFSISIPIFALFQSFLRLANIFQNTNICFYSTVMGCVVQGIIAFICYRELDLGINSIGIGYITNFLYCLVFFLMYYYYNNPDNILTSFTFKNIHFSGIFKQLKFAAFPMLNYMLFLMSCEFVSFLGFMIDDLHFTVLTCYMNILSVIVVISEAISASMSSLIGFSLGEKKYQMPFKLFFAALGLSILVQILMLGSLLLYPRQILGIFSAQEVFMIVAVKHVKLFVVAICLNSFHFILCEFIIVYGNHTLPFYALIVGKYVVQFGGAMILIPLYGFDGIIISMIIGQTVCILIFVYYMAYYVDFQKGQENFEICTSTKEHLDPLLDEDQKKEII